MPVFRLNKKIIFPPVHLSEPDGLLAAGGDLSIERLLLAYRSGIFPWYDEPPILWWSPDPRFVLFPSNLQVSASMRQVLRRQQFRITFNENFNGVIARCSRIARPGQSGTWITNEMRQAYMRLHEAGYAMSVESWVGDKLAGGLYGVKIGQYFFGESMFADVSNASKAAFITFVQTYAHELKMIDCQVQTDHLASLGAGFISREEFLELLNFS